MRVLKIEMKIDGSAFWEDLNGPMSEACRILSKQVVSLVPEPGQMIGLTDYHGNSVGDAWVEES